MLVPSNKIGRSLDRILATKWGILSSEKISDNFLSTCLAEIQYVEHKMDLWCNNLMALRCLEVTAFKSESD